MAIRLWGQIWSLSFWGSSSLKEALVSILLTNQIQNNHWKMWIGIWSNLFMITRFHEKKQALGVPNVFHHLVDFRFRWYQFVAIFLVKSRWTVSSPLKCGLHNFWNVSSPFTSLHCYRIIQSTFDIVYIFWEGRKISTLLLSYVVPGKSKVEISRNFVAFSEYTYKLYPILLWLYQMCFEWFCNSAVR
mgnify:CR=1 FL=1